jgi:hypothetical protein
MMTTLADQFQVLVDTGVVVPSHDAPRFEPLYQPRQPTMRTVYDLGEVMIRDGAGNAKLDASAGRNPDAGRQTT